MRARIDALDRLLISILNTWFFLILSLGYLQGSWFDKITSTKSSCRRFHWLTDLPLEAKSDAFLELVIFWDLIEFEMSVAHDWVTIFLCEFVIRCLSHCFVSFGLHSSLVLRIVVAWDEEKHSCYSTRSSCIDGQPSTFILLWFKTQIELDFAYKENSKRTKHLCCR